MSDWQRRGDGDSEIAAPAQEEPLQQTDLDEADAALASPDEPERDEVVRTKNRSLPDTTRLLLGGLLVLVVAQVVVSWFVLGTTTQVRDQYTIANGLQRCLIRAQLNENSATDTTGSAYKAAVQACLNK